MAGEKNIWTIGHSTRSMDVFIELLQAFSIGHVVDVRQFPGSRKYPHFNCPALKEALEAAGIAYTHLVQLGGRRKQEGEPMPSAWRHPAFAAYAAYMQTPSFAAGMEQLRAIAAKIPTAYMCSEAVWWRCHRALISDQLKADGWSVWHIMDRDKSTLHPYTQPARIVDGRLTYAAT